MVGSDVGEPTAAVWPPAWGGHSLGNYVNRFAELRLPISRCRGRCMDSLLQKHELSRRQIKVWHSGNNNFSIFLLY